jgi:WD40 repeat protein
MTSSDLAESPTLTVTSPYIGLVPYEASHADYFFGRDRESDIIATNLRVAKLTVLYGPSGVGKSSLISAGVVPELDGFRDEFFTIVFQHWRDDPVVSLNEEFGRILGTAERPDSRGLAESLVWWEEKVGRPLLLIFDQFEELFLYHPSEEGPESFTSGLPEALADPWLRANFLLVLREDALAKLDRFKGRVPKLFSNYLRVSHLDWQEGREAIEGPLRVWNDLHKSGFTAEEDLVDQVLTETQIETEHSVAAQPSLDGSDSNGDRAIETTHLQLVMSRIWDEERAHGSETLHLETLEHLGGGESIVRRHLEETLAPLTASEQDLAAALFGYLVTPTGSKVAHTAEDLAAMVDADPNEVTSLLERMASGQSRILRSVEPPPGQPSHHRFEIYHDVLAGAAAEWRLRHKQQQELAKARAALAKERRKRLAYVGVAVLVASVIGLTWLILSLNDKTASQQLAATSVAQSAVNPATGLGTALEAVNAAPTPEAEAALRLALNKNNLITELRGHTDAITSLDVSLDGELLATGGRDNTIRIWALPEGEQLADLEGHSNWVNDVEFSPDGKFLVSSSEDTTGIIWDVASGTAVHELDTLESQTRAHFSSDSRRVLLVGEYEVSIWDASSGELEDVIAHDNFVSNAEFSPDGQRVVTASWDGRARIWESGVGLMELGPYDPDDLTSHGHLGGVVDAAFSPDGAWVGTAGEYGEAYLWSSTEPGTEPQYLAVLSDYPVYDIEFDSTGESIITVNEKGAYRWQDESLTGDGQLWLSEPMTGGHTDWVYGSKFSGDGRLAVTWSNDGTARVWELSSSRELAAFQGHDGWVVDAEFAPRGDLVATASNDGVARLWRVPDVLTLQGHQDWVLAADLDSTGQLVSGGMDGIKVWDPSSGAQLDPLDSESEVQYLVTGDDIVVAADTQNYVRVLDLVGNNPATFDAALEGLSFVRGIDYDEVSATIAIAGTEGPTTLWDWRTDNKVQLPVVDQRQTVVAYSPEGTRLATGGEEGSSIRIWDTDTKSVVDELEGHEGAIKDLEYSESGDRLLSVGFDNTVRIWDPLTGEQLMVLEGHDSSITTAAFSADASRIATGSSGGVVGIWDSETGTNLAFLKVHSDYVNDIGFTPDGRIFSASDDHTIRIYECKTCGDLESLVALAETQIDAINGSASDE